MACGQAYARLKPGPTPAAFSPSKYTRDRVPRADRYPARRGVSPYGTGDQGFADPQQGLPAGWVPNDHIEFQQINIVNIENPFTQTEGEIYWLGIHVWWSGTQEPVGWKTTQDKFEDTAVYRPFSDGAWIPLVNPLDDERLELAFVITGEPPAVPALSSASLVILGLLLLAGVTFAIRRRAGKRPA